MQLHRYLPILWCALSVCCGANGPAFVEQAAGELGSTSDVFAPVPSLGCRTSPLPVAGVRFAPRISGRNILYKAPGGLFIYDLGDDGIVNTPAGVGDDRGEFALPNTLPGGPSWYDVQKGRVVVRQIHESGGSEIETVAFFSFGPDGLMGTGDDDQDWTVVFSVGVDQFSRRRITVNGDFLSLWWIDGFTAENFLAGCDMSLPQGQPHSCTAGQWALHSLGAGNGLVSSAGLLDVGHGLPAIMREQGGDLYWEPPGTYLTASVPLGIAPGAIETYAESAWAPGPFLAFLSCAQATPELCDPMGSIIVGGSAATFTFPRLGQTRHVQGLTLAEHGGVNSGHLYLAWTEVDLVTQAFDLVVASWGAPGQVQYARLAQFPSKNSGLDVDGDNAVFDDAYEGQPAPRLFVSHCL